MLKDVGPNGLTAQVFCSPMSNRRDLVIATLVQIHVHSLHVNDSS